MGSEKNLSAIMILGAYGAFGQRIAQMLAAKGHPLILVGRNHKKANALQALLKRLHPHTPCKVMCFDANSTLDDALNRSQPQVLIHCCGPFQGQGHEVLKSCIRHQVHYIDLADGREFVKDIQQYHEQAVAADIMAVTGASTVPTLSSAVLSYFQSQGMVTFDEVKYGISPGQKTDRGLATAQAVLSYVGRPIRSEQGQVYGWQGIYLQKYPDLSSRLMGHCDVPDLDVLPQHYPIKKLMFSAGMESKVLHMGIWMCSWLVRLGMPLNLPKHAGFWMKLSRYFDVLGSSDGGMHVLAKGKDNQGQVLDLSWFIVAKNGDGPYIPCVPAVILADRIMRKEKPAKGVYPCVGLIGLKDYLAELSPFDVTTY